MSEDLRDAIEEKQPYLKSSVDDLESLYWVALWAMVFNIYQPSTGRWQSRLRGSKPDRGDVSIDLTEYLDPAIHPAFVTQFAPVLESWGTKLKKLRNDWKRLLASSKTIPLHEGKFWPFQYHRFAYRGVCDILDVVKEHKNRLSQFPSFVQQLPGPSASPHPSSTKQTQPSLLFRPATSANVPRQSSPKRKRNEDDHPGSKKKLRSCVPKQNSRTIDSRFVLHAIDQSA